MKSLAVPCAFWAESLAAQPHDLSPADRLALDAHVRQCPACAAARADYHLMDARIRSLPDPRPLPGLPPRLLALWDEEALPTRIPSQRSSSRLLEAEMDRQEERGAAVPLPTPLDQRQHPRRRSVISGITAIAAVLVIVLITTALLVSHNGKPTKTGQAGNQTATPTASNQGWVNIPALTRVQVPLFIAPSDPNVVYEAWQHPVMLRRSNDDGVHWSTLSLPIQASEVESAYLIINPGKAQNVFLLLTLGQSSPLACPSGQASTSQIAAYSGGGCQIDYSSTDGGTHWKQMSWSAQAGGSGPVSTGDIVAQGDHLYSMIFDQNQHQRLIASTDDGATWQFADEDLRAQGQGLCNFTAASKGSAIFALAQAGYCTQAVGYLSSIASRSQDHSGVALWRSDDAGAHWAQVSGFPYQNPDTSALMAVNSDGAQPTLFAAAGVNDTYTRLVSTDGGQTWQPLPTQGIPGSAAHPSLFRAALSDGSVLTSVQAGQGSGISFYAWKPGAQAWHQVTPPFTGSTIDPIVVPAADGHDTLWLVTNDQGGFTVLHYTLK